MPKTEITVTMSVSIRDRLRLSIGVKITVHVIVRFSLGLSFSHFTWSVQGYGNITNGTVKIPIFSIVLLQWVTKGIIIVQNFHTHTPINLTWALFLANLPNRYSALSWRPVTHAHTWASTDSEDFLILGLNDITTHTPMSNDHIIAQLQKYVNIYDSPRWNLVSFSHNNPCHQDYLKHFLNLCSEFFPGSSKTNFVLLDYTFKNKIADVMTSSLEHRIFISVNTKQLHWCVDCGVRTRSFADADPQHLLDH